MVRGPTSGNGTRSSVYYLDSAGLVPPRPRRPRRWTASWIRWPRTCRLTGRSRPVPGSAAAGGARAAGGCCGRCGSCSGRPWWSSRSAASPRSSSTPPRRRRAGPAAGNATGEFPVSLAEAYATEFGRVYLGFSPQSLGQREQALAAFVPPGVSAANPSLGWNGTGQLNLQSLQVAGIKVQDRQHAVVTLLALLNGQLMELGVPVAATGSGLVVTGEPAWLPAPPRISPPAAPRRFGPGGPKPAHE